jgi:chromate reductase
MNQALQEVRPHFNDEELVNLTLEGSLRSIAQIAKQQPPDAKAGALQPWVRGLRKRSKLRLEIARKPKGQCIFAVVPWRCQTKLLVPENSEIDIIQLHGIPMFNEDDEKRPPSSVLELKKRIRSADAVLIVTPEYNYSIPGIVKNAIDWASRPQGDSAWSGKPVAIMGASLGALGTARAQYHLRQIFVTLNLFPLNQPEVIIADASHRFDENGNLIHEPTKQLIQQLLKNLVDWTRRISSAPA